MGTLLVMNSTFYYGRTASTNGNFRLDNIDNLTIVDSWMAYGDEGIYMEYPTNINVIRSYIIGYTEQAISMYAPSYIIVENSYFYDNTNSNNGKS